MLRNLSDVDKKDMSELLSAIGKTFSMYWRRYPPYETLQQRGDALHKLLTENSPDNHNGKYSAHVQEFCLGASRHVHPTFARPAITQMGITKMRTFSSTNTNKGANLPTPMDVGLQTSKKLSVSGSSKP